LASEIVDRYVFPDAATQIAETLRARAGQVPPDMAPAELAALLTQWAFEISNDRHLEVWYSPAQPDELTAGTRGDEFALERRHKARRTNCGLARIERLLGNVGLIELTSFF
jgi:hypothetical protein